MVQNFIFAFVSVFAKIAIARSIDAGAKMLPALRKRGEVKKGAQDFIQTPKAAGKESSSKSKAKGN